MCVSSLVELDLTNINLNYETIGKCKCNQTKSTLYSRGTLDIAHTVHITHSLSNSYMVVLYTHSYLYD